MLQRVHGIDCHDCIQEHTSEQHNFHLLRFGLHYRNSARLKVTSLFQGKKTRRTSSNLDPGSCCITPITTQPQAEQFLAGTVLQAMTKLTMTR